MPDRSARWWTIRVAVAAVTAAAGFGAWRAGWSFVAGICYGIALGVVLRTAAVAWADHDARAGDGPDEDDTPIAETNGA